MRNIALAVLALLIAGTASSQGRFGARAGVVLNYINVDGGSTAPDYSDLKAGHTFSFSYELPASKNFVIQPELGFVRLSSNESITNSTVNLDYITLPVILKFVTNSQNFSVYAGPQLSFLTNANNRTSAGKVDIRENLTETDFSAAAGIEYITPVNVTINLRYVQGMSNVFKVEYDDFTSRHQYVSVTVGYLFGRKKK
ncbi:MAG TPA: porin family protein [Chitinophagaceae bacterium]|nr:porin family protein [Chitinophagaceae bacterium]